jgi:pantetheine-phosphate adenylyltransferase
MPNKLAIYPGTFDPITNGHLDLVERALRIFDELIVAVAPSPKKNPLFSVEERMDLFRESVKKYPNVTVEPLRGLLANYMRSRGAVTMIRGLRAISDYEYELQMALMNRRIDIEVETVFLMPSEDYSFISSTVVKEVASFGVSVKGLVPECVEAALRKKYISLGNPPE